ncbi:MAG: AraC family transcriptional regulator [bacterium]
MSLIKPFRLALPVSEEHFHDPLYLTHAGWEEIKKGDFFERQDPPYFNFHWEEGRILGEFCLALVTSGKGEYETKQHHQGIIAGNAFFFRPGEWHRHRPDPKTGWTIKWIHFNGTAPLQWMREDLFLLRGNTPVVRKKALFRAQLESLLEEAHRLFPNNSANLSRQAMGLLAQFLGEPSALLGHTISTIKDASIRQAVEYIWNFSHGIVDVPSVAAHVGIPRRSLDRRFRMLLGKSVLDEIQFCRVSRAAKLLEETQLPVKNIVHRAGFRNEEHLRLAFHKVFHQSPQAHRSQSKSMPH